VDDPAAVKRSLGPPQIGRRFRYELQVSDPIAVIEALADAGAPEHVRTAARHPVAIYARWKHSASRRWNHPALKFLVFALVPTLPLFVFINGSPTALTFGEYYTYGLTAYLLAFAVYWATYTIYLCSMRRPARRRRDGRVRRRIPRTVTAATARRTVEIADGILYYGGVPVLLILMFLR